jgi:hypothetical protein
VDLLDRDSSNSPTAASSRDRDFCWDDAEPSFHAARLRRTVSMARNGDGEAPKSSSRPKQLDLLELRQLPRRSRIAATLRYGFG